MSKKFFTFILSLILVFNYSFAQNDDWKILTTNVELYSIKFISDSKAWIFGGQFSYKSIDGGMSWTNPIYSSVNVGFSGSYYNTYPTYLIFSDSLNGWAVNGDNTKRITISGGESWGSGQFINNSNNLYYAIDFINSTTGWAAGKDSVNSKSILIKSTNRGFQWTIINNSIRWPNVRSMKMLNQNTGFLTFYSKDSFAVTSDGGFTWTYKHSGFSQPIARVYFTDSLNGWLIGERLYTSRTTNGGNEWIVYSNNITDASNCYFINSATGWICTSFGGIWKTTNSGINWNQQYMPGSILRDIYFKNSSTGWVVEKDGFLWKSTNGGTDWNKEFSKLSYPVISISFVNVNTGYVLTSNNQVSWIWKTTDRGYKWVQKGYIGNVCNKLQFTDFSTGYVCKNAKDIHKTTNEGANWSVINVSTHNIKSFSYLNSSTGWCVGAAGTIVKTTNGGMNWVNQTIDTTKILNDVNFIDSQTGMIAANDGFILKTSNGGANWSVVIPFIVIHYNGIKLLSSSICFAIGSINGFTPPYYPWSRRVLLKTTDFGNTWTHPIDETYAIAGRSMKYLFFIGNSGWVINSDNGVYKSTNQGNNWFSDQPFLNESYNCIQFVDVNNGWMGGGNGTILSTASPIGISTLNNNIPESFLLFQNYPNPFNPTTKIRFDMPFGNDRYHTVQLIIFDILGREVAVLVNEQLKPGMYEVEWDGSNYSSGVYFYKLIVRQAGSSTGDFVQTKKMVLMK